MREGLGSEVADVFFFAYRQRSVFISQSKIVFFSTDGAFSLRPRAADHGAARLSRRGIDRGRAGRWFLPRPRPVARVAHSQSKNIE